MNIRDLKPANQIYKGSGAKILLYGPPGTGKSPMCAALNNAVGIWVEPSLSSVRNSNTYGLFTQDLKKIKDFFKWVFGSNEVNKFDTIFVDSLSYLCRIYLNDYKSKSKDLRRVYALMMDDIMKIVTDMISMKQKNIVLLAHKCVEERLLPGQPKDGMTYSFARPSFPGKALLKDVPHDMDEIMYAHRGFRPDGQEGVMIATLEKADAYMARSRSGKLNPIEPPDLNYLIAKINS